jgi:hypothetical protein
VKHYYLVLFFNNVLVSGVVLISLKKVYFDVQIVVDLLLQFGMLKES